MCGQKNAGSHGKSFGLALVGKDEHGRFFDVDTKKEARRLRRTREKRAWRKELL
jgi:hypothetical protein